MKIRDFHDTRESHCVSPIITLSEQKRKIINGDILHATGKNSSAHTEEMNEEMWKISNEGTIKGG